MTKFPQYLLLSGGKKCGVYTRSALLFEVGLSVGSGFRIPNHGQWKTASGITYEWYKLEIE